MYMLIPTHVHSDTQVFALYESLCDFDSFELLFPVRFTLYFFFIGHEKFSMQDWLKSIGFQSDILQNTKWNRQMRKGTSNPE